VIAAFLSALAGCGERPLEPREPTPGVAHYRFVTYNVHFPEARDRKTIDALKRTHGDVLCLQETDAAWHQALVAAFAADYPFMLFEPLDGAAGLGVISRFPLTDLGILPRSEGWHPAWYVMVETPAGPVQLLNVHLRAVFDGEGDPLSSVLDTGGDHVQEMKAFTSVLSAEMPSVVLGDFNEGVDGGAVSYLERRQYRNALPLFRPGQPTWRGTSVGGALEMTLDHVLFDRYFEPLNAYVVNGGNSDHLPVVAHLEASAKWRKLFATEELDEPDTSQN
jgi:endonuclease/exonuclease/phosphatase family metal-dependent hydrolase